MLGDFLLFELNPYFYQNTNYETTKSHFRPITDSQLQCNYYMLFLSVLSCKVWQHNTGIC
ncbi:hypothetical protein E27107_10059 [Elizabethkingia anophelis]|nr:hypothetical protein E18064_440061 [Elizabethkingia anophelis]CDN76657.1 hypothetical protein E27107_10059 [Elizabethkingia anophelis]